MIDCSKLHHSHWSLYWLTFNWIGNSISSVRCKYYNSVKRKIVTILLQIVRNFPYKMWHSWTYAFRVRVNKLHYIIMSTNKDRRKTLQQFRINCWFIHIFFSNKIWHFLKYLICFEQRNSVDGSNLRPFNGDGSGSINYIVFFTFFRWNCWEKKNWAKNHGIKNKNRIK